MEIKGYKRIKIDHHHHHHHDSALSKNHNHKQQNVILPNIVVRYILQLLYNDHMESIHHGVHVTFRNNLYDLLNNDISWGKSYCMVNWYWFSVCQQLYCFSDYNFSIDNLKPMINLNSSSNSNNSKSIVITKKTDFININLVKNLNINLKQLNLDLINSVNNMKMLENIKIVNDYYNGEFHYQPSIFKQLNQLGKNINVEFKLYIENGIVEEQGKEQEQHQPFTFNTTKFIVSFDCIPPSYSVITRMMRDIQPKSLIIDSTSHTESGGSHLHSYHSLSRLCKEFESIEINSDFIPLYSLYHFLRSPKLSTLKFNLQFHFISSLYNNSEDSFNLDFNQCDQFSFNIDKSQHTTHQQQQQLHDKQWYMDKNNTINEDNQIFCGYDRFVEGNDFIPPYSFHLWNQCLLLLKETKTITELSIGQCYCGDKTAHGRIKSSDLLIRDIVDALSNNRSIRKLTLEDDYGDDQNEPINFCTPAVIVEILDTNLTLEFLYLQETGKNQEFIEKIIDEIRQMTINKKCKVLKRNIEYY
ncbi:hypothetical protein CYY_003464 [Polysphondylium violaceum]|uniref:Uncharacterized protein n=1 Tax=Polysphondylium violaceum TaxID=133409 RepID=A0A8J4PWZ7_9MYCE|nr:hypothetical protein CYY_003464 [Polysphondylium violaceum]